MTENLKYPVIGCLERTGIYSKNGGVVVYVREDLMLTRREDLELAQWKRYGLKFPCQNRVVFS